MNSRLATLALLLSLTAGVELGCAHKQHTETRTPTAPPTVRNLDDFAAALNVFVLLPEDDPSRGPFRDALHTFLESYIASNLQQDERQEALTALQFASTLYTSGELRALRSGRPALARQAHALYEVASRVGSEQPAMFALAVEIQFGDEPTRQRAIADWQTVEDWVLRNAMYAEEPLLRHEELQTVMYETAAIFPSPFVVKRLGDLYLARYAAAVNLSDNSSALGMEARRRAEFTSYLLARLYLRADDLPGAIKALQRMDDDVMSRRGAELIEHALNSEDDVTPLITLAAQFKPDDDPEMAERTPPAQLTESWGIIENLSRRAIRKFPRSPEAHSLYAEALRQAGLIDASVTHYERSLALQEDQIEVWRALAELKQQQLVRLGEQDTKEVLARLKKLEAFHKRAVELWRDRPIEPGLASAYYAVALVLYNEGKVGDARGLLTRSIALEPLPPALELLATIEYKSARFDAARAHYSALLGLPFEHQLQRLRWETSARAGLARTARSQGDGEESERQLRTALRELNMMIAFPGLSDDERSSRLIERGKLMFYTGDITQSVADFRQARTLAPDDANAFTEPMLFVVSHGYYAEALEIYRAALANDELRDTLKLYFSLWLNDLALRQGQEVDADALAFVHQFSGGRDESSWPKRLALHAQGKMSFEQLIEHAADPGEQAEAYFYEGLRRWRTGNPTSGKELMRKVLSTQMMGFFEFDMARSYLEWNDLPQNARAPSPSTKK